MGFFDILIIAAVALAVALALYRIVTNRKKGKICGGNCSSCSACTKCEKKDAK